jgi:hypothetical protein
MAKPNTTPIDEEDLKAFVASESDFAFEMGVLSLLRKINCTCSHAGTYVDPVTGKIRQYDLRAEKIEGNFKLALAVECKNLRPNFPLLISAVPRTTDEAFHDIVVLRLGTILAEREVRHVDRGQSIYRPGDMVGKQTDQVGRRTVQAGKQQISELFSDDNAAFDKANQAINSSKDIFITSASHSARPLVRVVVPVLVVPSGMLWQVDYDGDGNIKKYPYRVNEATYFIDHAWKAYVGSNDLNYRISHLHIVTQSHLEDAVKDWVGPNGFFKTETPG